MSDTHAVTQNVSVTISICLNIYKHVKSLTSTFLNSDFNDRQVGRHILQHTHFSNQVATGKIEQRQLKTSSQTD